ncbi:MAG: hypothetical protein PHV24_02285, partial [Candidatus Kapabacteria bacterium]|nr:hypothetical protein [Candidatus Kapabacteria bacterium]
LGTTTVSTALDEIAVPFLNYNTAGTSVQVTTTPVDVKVEFINILAPGEAPFDSQEFTNVAPNSYGVVSVNFQGTVQGVTTETKYKEFGIEGVKTATENYMFRISTRTANTADEYKVVSYVSVFDQVLRNMASVGNAAEGAEVTNGSVTPAKIAASDNPGDVMLTTDGANVGHPTEVAWGKITNANIADAAADLTVVGAYTGIAGSKIDPNFGARDVTALNFTATDKLIGANLEIGTPDAEEVLADNNGIKVTKDGVIMGMGAVTEGENTENVIAIAKLGDGTSSAAGVIQTGTADPMLFTSPDGGSTKKFTADVEGNVTAKSLNVTGNAAAVTLPAGSIENADLASGIAQDKITKGNMGQVLVSGNTVSEWVDASTITVGTASAVAASAAGKVLTSINDGVKFTSQWTDPTTVTVGHATTAGTASAVAASAAGKVLTSVEVTEGVFESQWTAPADLTVGTATTATSANTVALAAGLSVITAINSEATAKIAPAKVNPGTAGQILTTLAGATAWTDPENITVGKATTASQIITTGNNSEKVLLGAVTEEVPATWGKITSAYIADGTITNADIAAYTDDNPGIDVAKIKLAGPINTFDVPTANSVYLVQADGTTGAFGKITDDYVAPKVAGTYAGISSQKINFGDGISQAVIFGDASADNFVKIDPFKAVDGGEDHIPMFSVTKSTQLKYGPVAQIDATFTANPDPNSGDSQVGLGVTSEFSGVQTVSILGYKADGFNTGNPTALFLTGDADADAIYVEAGKSTLQETVIGT